MTRERKRLYIFFVSYFLVLMCITVLPPVVGLWNTIEPRILGLPFAQLTVIVLALLFCLGLLGWFRLEGKLNTREKRLRQNGEPLEY